MPRSRQDGTPAASPNRRKFNDLLLKRLKPRASTFRMWDTQQRGLLVQVQPSGNKIWKVVYHFGGRARWYTIGPTNAIALADARRIAARIMLAVLEGRDPQADRTAERSKGTFEELAARYVNEHAKKNNKSWAQADRLVQRYLVPKWGKLQAANIARSDVETLLAGIAAPVLANQVLASASAIFSWAVKKSIVSVNPCSLAARNPTKDRERVLSDEELPQFWNAFDDAGLVRGSALKMLLLLGQRPGEIICMHRDHIAADGWWTLPGEPVAELNWPGTKNKQTHRVWLPEPAQKLLALLDDGTGGRVFAGENTFAIARAMRLACKKLKAERATPHDLRRTHGTTIAALGFGRDCMNRIQNHKEGGIGSVYDRHSYAAENKKVMDAVATRIILLVDGAATTNVIEGKFKR